MSKITPEFNWFMALGNEQTDGIGNDYILLFERHDALPTSSEPFISNATTAVICLKGSIEGNINLRPFKSEAPSLTIVMPDQF